jgi:hypothetical protein
MSDHGRMKIPIPSFRPPPPEESFEANTSSDSNRKNKNKNGNKTDRPSKTKMSEMANKTTKIRLPINEQTLIQVESALQLHLHHHQQQQNGDRISFTDFFKIASKIDINFTIPSTKDNKVDDDRTNSNVDSDSDSLWKLSKEERLWHDIYCVAVPALYRLDDPNNGGDHSSIDPNKNENNNNSSSNNNARKKAAAALALTRVSFPAATTVRGGEGNRLKELRRLIREVQAQGIVKAKSKRAFDLLLSLRLEKTKYDQERTKMKSVLSKDKLGENGSGDANNSNSKGVGPDKNKRSLVASLLQDAGSTNNTNATMIVENDGKSTIEDRVRARAKEREQNMEQARAARKDPREERVAIADALYSYASHVLRRTRCRTTKQQQASSTSSSSSKTSNSGTTGVRGLSSSSRFLGRTTTTTTGAKTANSSSDNMGNISSSPSKCILTFKEVVTNALPNRSRKEIARLMLDIVQVLSMTSQKEDHCSHGVSYDFIKWREPESGGETNGLPISKKATVWIDTANFKDVRAVLNKEKTTDENQIQQKSQRQSGKKRPVPANHNDAKSKKNSR